VTASTALLPATDRQLSHIVRLAGRRAWRSIPSPLACATIIEVLDGLGAHVSVGAASRAIVALEHAGPAPAEPERPLILCDGVWTPLLEVRDHPPMPHPPISSALGAREWVTARGSRWSGLRADGSLFHEPLLR